MSFVIELEKTTLKWSLEMVWFQTVVSEPQNIRGNVQKKSRYKDIIQIKGDHPPSYPIFDKFWLGRAPTLPTEFLTKI